MHIFSSRLNFNPHVHMLVTMGGLKSNGEWKTYDYVPFEMLRKQWQTVVKGIRGYEYKITDVRAT
ncbi:transposase [Paenibacillus sp. LjRoot153]